MPHVITVKKWRGRQRHLIRKCRETTDQVIRDVVRGVNPVLDGAGQAAAGILNLSAVAALATTVQITVR